MRAATGALRKALIIASSAPPRESIDQITTTRCRSLAGIYAYSAAHDGGAMAPQKGGGHYAGMVLALEACKEETQKVLAGAMAAAGQSGDEGGGGGCGGEEGSEGPKTKRQKKGKGPKHKKGH